MIIINIEDTCVELLLKHGANVNIVRADGATPLWSACHRGHEGVAKEILKYKPHLGLLKVIYISYFNCRKILANPNPI